jgi:hypothetical protein
MSSLGLPLRRITTPVTSSARSGSRDGFRVVKEKVVKSIRILMKQETLREV